MAHEAAASRRHHRARRRRSSRSSSRPGASRATSSARRRSSASGSRIFVTSSRRCRALARPAAAPARHRHPGRAVRRGARAVAAGRDPERRGHRRGGRVGDRPDVPPRHPRPHGRAGRGEVPRTIQGGRDIGRQRSSVDAAALGAIAAVGALLLVVGPEFLRQGASALLVLSRSAEAASPYAIKVDAGRRQRAEGIRSGDRARSSPASARTTSR